MHPMGFPCQYLLQWSRHMEWQDVISVTLEMCARARHMYISLRPAHESSILHLPSSSSSSSSSSPTQPSPLSSSVNFLSCLPAIPVPLVNSDHEIASLLVTKPIASSPRPLVWLPRLEISS